MYLVYYIIEHKTVPFIYPCNCNGKLTFVLLYICRCPNYPALPSSCVLVTDPKDKCCEIPRCFNANATNPTEVINGTKGTIFGRPQPNTPFTGSRSKNHNWHHIIKFQM